MAKLNERAAAITKLGTICVALTLGLALEQVAGFPSLFNMRSQSLFKRNQQPQQLQQQQQQQQQQQPQAFQPQQQAQKQDQILTMANSQAPLLRGAPLDAAKLHFGQANRQPLPAELLRTSNLAQQISAHQMLNQNVLSSAASQPQQQRHFIYADNEHDSHYSPPVHAGAFYRPGAGSHPLAAGAMLQPAQPLVGQEQSGSFDLGDHTSYFSEGPAAGPRSADKPQRAQAGQLHLEPTHTSEIVDKIERHIGQQIERNLKQGGEKEAAQSEEQEETVGGGGGESAADEAGEEKIEKRHEEPHKEQAESHHHHHHEHHEHHHPPEAFEVHHKKGGKSFQYFHQGHHHA